MKLLEILPIGCLAVAFSPIVSAQTVWTGSVDSDWNTAGNWSNGVPLSGGATATVATIDLDGTNISMSSSPGIIGGVTLSAIGNATLNITHDMTLSGNLANFYVGGASTNVAGYSGTVNHTSGTVTMTSSNAWDLIISHGAQNAANTGVYNFGGTSGSPAVFVNESRGVRIGQRSNDNGTLAMDGHGSFSVAGSVGLGQANGTALWSIRGGDLDININTAGAIDSNGLNLGNLGSTTSATIAATFTNTGFSTINVGGNVKFMNSSSAAGGNRTFFTLDLDPGFSATMGEEFTIISATGTFENYGMFSNVAHGSLIAVGEYEFQAAYLDNTTSRDFILTTVAIPEPGHVALLTGGFGFLLIFMRRRFSNK